MVKLQSPVLRVVLGDVEDEDTWDEHTVRILGRDMQATEELLAQTKRGTLGDNPITGQAMFAYFALRRVGKIAPGTTWPEFQNAYLEVTTDDGDSPAVPTLPAAGPES